MGQKGKSQKNCFRTFSEAVSGPLGILCFIDIPSSKEEGEQSHKSLELLNAKKEKRLSYF